VQRLGFADSSGIFGSASDDLFEPKTDTVKTGLFLLLLLSAAGAADQEATWNNGTHGRRSRVKLVGLPPRQKALVRMSSLAASVF
jgi:hypothetical protein